MNNSSLEIYSLYDEKTRLFGSLMLFHNVEEAKRYFSFIVNEDSNRLIAMDLILYRVGSYDIEEGYIASESVKPFKVMTSLDVFGGVENG